MKKRATDRNPARGGATNEKAFWKSIREKLNEAKQSLAAGDKGTTREELLRRSRIRRSRVRRK